MPAPEVGVRATIRGYCLLKPASECRSSRDLGTSAMRAGWNNGRESMMTISRRGLVGVGVGSVGSLVLARVAPPVAAAQTQASLQMGWIANVENAGEFVAAEKGYYAAEGVDLELVPGGPGVSVEPLVVSGNALVGLSQPDN